MEQNEHTPKWARTDYKGFETFKKDLAIANKTEAEISLLIAKKFNLDIVGHNNDYRYDTKFRDKKGADVTVEIKEDFTCARTGNVGVEHSCRGKASGISISEADYYFYKCHLGTDTSINLMMSTKSLKKLIADKRYFREINGGDPGSNSLNYLFKLDVIHSISVVV